MADFEDGETYDMGAFPFIMCPLCVLGACGRSHWGGVRPINDPFSSLGMGSSLLMVLFECLCEVVPVP